MKFQPKGGATNSEPPKAPNQQGPDCPTGIMKDSEYVYCYQNLLIETKEWSTTMEYLIMYLRGEKPADPIKKQPKIAKKTDKARRKKKDDHDHARPRCVKLKATMDQKTKLQNYEVLKFSSAENMAEFLQFLL